MKGQEIITCPQCGSNKVRKAPHLGCVIFLAAGFCSFIPVIGFVLGPLLLLLSFFTAFNRSKGFICQECKQGIKVSKETYKEYINYFKSKGDRN